MGDLASPRRRDVVDRIRERLKEYRRRDGDASARYHNYYSPNVYENQRQDTLLLSQRWQESKAKKTAKSSTRPSRDSTSNQQTQHRLKRKLEGTSSTEASGPDHYKFEDQLSPPPKAQCTQQQQQQQQANSGFADPSQSQSSHCVSVNIVQQINAAPRNLNSEIKINVQSTVHTSQCTTASTSTEIKTNICKEEPKETSAGAPTQAGSGPTANPPSQSSYPDSIGLEDVDELQQILDALEKEEGVISPELMLAVENKLDADNPRDNQNLQSESSSDNLHQTTGHQVSPQQNTNLQHSSEFNKHTPSNFYGRTQSSDATDSQTQQTSKDTQQRRGGMYAEPYETPSQPANSNFGNMGGPAAANCISGYPSSPTGPSTPTGAAVPPLPPLGEPGPAAETLKQMAAQHQSNEYKMPYGAYGPEGYPESLARRPGFPPGYNVPGYMGPQNGTYPYSHQMGSRMPYPQGQNGMPSGPHIPRGSVSAQGPRTPMQQHPMQGHSPHGMSGQSPEAMKPNPPYTKPLAHYGPNASGSTSPSSLQQLQDQVKTQFNQASHPHIHMSDSQMQFSQSQQMRMTHPGMQMSQTQRMQFHSQGNHNISVAQQQSFNMSYNGSTGQRPMTPQQQSQYMNEQMRMKMYQEKMMREQEMRRMQQFPGGHPPPEYPSAASNSNPLQTMQSMVEQTNHGSDSRSAMYPAGGMKQESLARHSMPAAAPPRTSPAQVPASSQAQPFPSQPSSSTATTSQNATPQSAGSVDVKSDSSNYTSAIMRGQRPPNVNVGPDGLNISQPRMPGWSRPMMGGQMGQGPMMAGPHPGMHYGGYGNQTSMNMHGHARMHMSQQQAIHMQRTMSGGMPSGHSAMPQGHPSAMPAMQSGAMSHQQQLLMSQQQQLHMQNGHTMSAMSQGNAMSSRTACHPSQAPGYPHTHPGNQGNTSSHNYALDFLDNPQASNPDFFDPVVQSGPEFSFIDDILGGK